MSIIIKRPLSDAQKKIIADKDKPSAQAQMQALDDFVNYVGLKLLELEEKQNGTQEESVEYTC